MSGVVVNGDNRFFRALYLPHLHILDHNYYIVLCIVAPWLFIDAEMDDLE